MAENVSFELIGNKFSKHNGDTSILLIDHDTASIASLTLMFQKLSYKVMCVNMASEAVSMIERQKDIILVIANIEMPHIDSHSFHTSLLARDIPFILINPGMKTDKSSDCLKERACYFLTKPISEEDINNMLHHVLPEKSQKLQSISITKSEEDIMEEHKRQIEAFRETLKSQRTVQTSPPERRILMRTFTAYEEYQKRRNVALDEWKKKQVCPIEMEDKRKEEDKMEGDLQGERMNLWTCERHMKFLSAIHTLGDKDSRPKSILKIMNDRNLTQQQVASHLQEYKAQVDQMNDTLLMKEWITIAKTFEYPSECKYPFKASNLEKNIISAEKPIKERDTNIIKFLLGGKMDLNDHSSFGNIPNSLSMEADGVSGVTNNIPPDNISSTNNVNYADLVPTSLTSNNISELSGLPSRVGSSNTGNVIPSEINMEESLVQYDEGYDVPIEDMISFDNDINEMDMWYVLGNNGFSETNVVINTHIGHEAYDTPQEEENDVHGDNESLNWIDNVLNEDV